MLFYYHKNKGLLPPPMLKDLRSYIRTVESEQPTASWWGAIGLTAIAVIALGLEISTSSLHLGLRQLEKATCTINSKNMYKRNLT